MSRPEYPSGDLYRFRVVHESFLHSSILHAFQRVIPLGEIEHFPPKIEILCIRKHRQDYLNEDRQFKIKIVCRRDRLMLYSVRGGE